MKAVIAIAGFCFAVSAHAAVLTPVTSTVRQCQAQVTDATYRVQAVCWKNSAGELRMWFPVETLKSMTETKINAKFIGNVTAACAATSLYEYADLFGDNKKPESEIATKEVEIAYAHLDASGCFPQ